MPIQTITVKVLGFVGSGGVTLPITLNPSDVLAQDTIPAMQLGLTDNGVFNFNLNDANTAGIADQLFISRRTTGTPEAGFGCDLMFLLQDTSTATTQAAEFNISWDNPDGSLARCDIQVTSPTDGTFSFRGTGAFKLPLQSDPPSPAEEGMIYADTDHHLYYYNGTTWKQLDN